MEVIHVDFQDIPVLSASSCCIGYFDGFHLGHQALIQKAVEVAHEKNILAGLITFDPDPWVVFKPDANLDHLTSMEDRIQLAKQMGIEVFYILHFTKEFASLEPDAFHNVLHAMHVECLVCGFDYHYGKKNAGSVSTLSRQTLFELYVIDSVNAKSLKISSTRIENLIREGKMLSANQLLDMYYSMEGIVAQGFQRGTTLLGIPTANLELSESYVIPATGVYTGYMQYNGQFYQAMINVGKNPTFGNEHMTVEGHILDFDEMIYGAKVRFFFVSKIRDEIKFPGLEALRFQLLSDIETTRIELRKHDLHYMSMHKYFGHRSY